MKLDVEKVSLRGYQIEGVNWLLKLNESGMGGILADEMVRSTQLRSFFFMSWQGLGKTLQILTFLTHLKMARGEKNPSLLIVPKSVRSELIHSLIHGEHQVLSNWTTQCETYTPTLRMLRFHGDKDERVPVMLAVTSILSFFLPFI